MMMIIDDDDDCKVADEHVPLISELHDQKCQKITENVAQLDEIIEEKLHNYAKKLHLPLIGEHSFPCMRKTTR